MSNNVEMPFLYETVNGRHKFIQDTIDVSLPENTKSKMEQWAIDNDVNMIFICTYVDPSSDAYRIQWQIRDDKDKSIFLRWS